MNKNLRFCFRVDKSVGLAEDEFGNPSDFYICLKAKNVKTYTVKRKEYKTLQESFRNIAASELKCDVSKLIPITLNEYLDETGSED
jgi:hypothetical protein